MAAAGNGCFDVVKLLVAAGARVNHVNNKNQTALSLALAKNRFDIADYLKRLGASDQ
jgi:ankyrin repeat protein